ncbi:unnamed protein product [Protopolystoma xenopodis]|uniref:Uncharacterized protein n=1 Tax=Protopolystoma xenopodis TaxID=117903 RepID=A0A448WFQ4_9PLAT|nr:unnamed protein product [Protopolystoma xenopodis]
MVSSSAWFSHDVEVLQMSQFDSSATNADESPVLQSSSVKDISSTNLVDEKPTFVTRPLCIRPRTARILAARTGYLLKERYEMPLPHDHRGYRARLFAIKAPS